jgi:hypothetical protein
MLPPRRDWDIRAFVDTTRTLSFQYPDKGHVLYVQVGTNIRGPTCLFANATCGGDLLRRNSVELVTVPALPGRLLQFRGNVLQAVPRPADL